MAASVGSTIWLWGLKSVVNMLFSNRKHIFGIVTANAVAFKCSSSWYSDLQQRNSLFGNSIALHCLYLPPLPLSLLFDVWQGCWRSLLSLFVHQSVLCKGNPWYGLTVKAAFGWPTMLIQLSSKNGKKKFPHAADPYIVGKALLMTIFILAHSPCMCPTWLFTSLNPSQAREGWTLI